MVVVELMGIQFPFASASARTVGSCGRIAPSPEAIVDVNKPSHFLFKRREKGEQTED